MPSGKVKWFNSKKAMVYITDDKTKRHFFMFLHLRDQTKST